MAARTPIHRGLLARLRLAAALTAALALVMAGPVAAASATSPVRLGAGYVMDDVGVMSAAEEQQVDERLRTLSEQTGVGLYGVIVDAPTDPDNIRDWADAVASQNDLGANEYILAIAVGTGEYYISADDSGPVTEARLTQIESDIQPLLAAGDFVGVFDQAADVMATDVADASSDQNTALEPDTSPLTIALIVVAAIAVIAVVIVLIRRRKKRPVEGAAGTGAPPVPLEEIERQASSALVETDDAIRTSEQELGFATAQFGEEATREFSAALAAAKEKLNQAFTYKQQLDDEVPDTEEQKRAWNSEIVQLCLDANAGLDEKAAAFDELRKLEAEAPAALERARAERGSAASGIDAAAATLQGLRANYAPEALETVDDNIDQARARIAFADEQLAEAQTALAAGDTGEAAVGIRAAEEAVGQAALLEAAIDTLATDLAAGAQQADEVIAGLENDIRMAQSLPDPDGRIAAVISQTQASIAAARADTAGTARRPLQTLQQLQTADRTIDEVVQSVRDAASRAQRIAQQLDSTIAQAQAQVSAAESFVTARRGAVGAEARTRLAEAGAGVVRAQQLRTSDPDRALSEAQRANDLASQAIQSARSDVGGFSVPSNYGGSGGGAGSSFVGALLGGIVGDAMFGGGSGRSSSGFGGGFGGGGFGGGFSSGGSSRGRSGGGSFRAGSFGGGGTRGRRGGGRF